MRVARASEPDVALRVGGLGGDLGERLARALEGEGDADARLALELVGDGLAPLGLDTAVDVEATLGEDGGRRHQHHGCEKHHRSQQPRRTRHQSATPLPLDSRSRYSPTREDGYDPG